MDATGDPGPYPGEEGCGGPRPAAASGRLGAVGAEVGVRGGVLPAARREQRTGAVPEAMEQSCGRFQEDQGVGVEEIERV